MTEPVTHDEHSIPICLRFWINSFTLLPCIFIECKPLSLIYLYPVLWYLFPVLTTVRYMIIHNLKVLPPFSKVSICPKLSLLSMKKLTSTKTEGKLAFVDKGTQCLESSNYLVIMIFSNSLIPNFRLLLLYKKVLIFQIRDPVILWIQCIVNSINHKIKSWVWFSDHCSLWLQWIRLLFSSKEILWSLICVFVILSV